MTYRDFMPLIEAWYVWFHDSRRSRIMPEGYSAPRSEDLFDLDLARMIERACFVDRQLYLFSKHEELNLGLLTEVVKRRYNDGEFKDFSMLQDGALKTVTKREAKHMHGLFINYLRDACINGSL